VRLEVLTTKHSLCCSWAMSECAAVTDKLSNLRTLEHLIARGRLLYFKPYISMLLNDNHFSTSAEYAQGRGSSLFFHIGQMSGVDVVGSDQPQAKAKDKNSETTFTLRRTPYTYLHLGIKQISTKASQQLDEVTAQFYLHSALSQFLGLTGTAIQFDLLKVEGIDIWLRVAKEDASAVVAAVSQWASMGQGVSLQVKARGTWLGAVMARGKTDGKLWTLAK
jgi:ribonuclease P/MRP protein subunit POP8